MNRLRTWVLRGMAAVAALALLPGCSMLSSMGRGNAEADLPYSEEVQRAWFEGQGHLLKGDLEDAYASFLTCAEAEPDEFTFHYNLGKIDLELTRFEAAERHLNTAVELAPGNSWVAHARGLARLGLGDGDGAAEDFKTYVTDRPGDLEAVAECTWLLEREGHVGPALGMLAHYETTVGLDPDVRLEALGLVEQVAEPKELGMFLAKAVEDFPGEEVFGLQLARWYLATGNDDAGLAQLLVVLERSPDWGMVHLELGEYYGGNLQFEKALQHLAVAFASDEVPLENKLQMTLAFGIGAPADQVVAEGYKMLTKLLDTHHGDDPKVLEFVMDQAYFEGDLDKAVANAERVVELVPGSLEPWTNLLALRAELRQWEAVLAESEQALARFPLEPLLYYHQGVALSELGRSADAATALRGGLAVVVDDPTTESGLAARLAYALRDLNDYDGAEAAFERSLAALEDPYVLNNHAYFLATRHSLPEGRALLERALECSALANERMPDEGNFMDTHATVLFKLQRFDEALDWIVRAQANGMAGVAVALEHEGDIRRALGDEAGAKQAYRAALEAGGNPKVLNPKLSRE